MIGIGFNDLDKLQKKVKKKRIYNLCIQTLYKECGNGQYINYFSILSTPSPHPARAKSERTPWHSETNPIPNTRYVLEEN